VAKGERRGGVPQTAVILAAGMGSRLRDVFSDAPKGFIEIGGETLIERSLRVLRERGIERVVIVAGHLAGDYRALADRLPGVEIVENAAFADTGSMASLAIALEDVDEDFLLLESDLFYDEAAIDALLALPERNVLLASGPTRATDEVWVEAKDGALTHMSKDPAEVGAVYGELVGILRISRDLGRRLARAFADFEAREGHGRMSYELDALLEALDEQPVHVHLMPDLLWGEVDYESHYHRVRDEVYPRWRELSAGRASEGAA
jgi:2-aminoethylphosphonate-pyruvate transaminase